MHHNNHRPTIQAAGQSPARPPAGYDGVRLDQVRAATDNVRRDAAAIAAACAEAGKPADAAAFIAAGTGIDAVRRALAGAPLVASTPAPASVEPETSAFGPRSHPITFGFDAASIPTRFDKPSAAPVVSEVRALDPVPVQRADRAAFETGAIASRFDRPAA